MQAIASQCVHHFKADAYIGQPNMHNYRAEDHPMARCKIKKGDIFCPTP